jgi:hypothetical protein
MGLGQVFFKDRHLQVITDFTIFGVLKDDAHKITVHRHFAGFFGNIVCARAKADAAIVE